MRRSIVALAGALLVMALFPALAPAQTPSPTPSVSPTASVSPTPTPSPTDTVYPPNEPSCLANRSEATPGDRVSITGDGWFPGSTVDLDFIQSNPTVRRDLGDAETNASGTFVATVTVPEAAHRGAAEIVLTGPREDGQTATCTVDLTISAGPVRDACAQVSDDIVSAGQTIRVFSAPGCWQPGTTNRLFFRSDPVFIGEATVRPDGSFSVTVQIPEDATVGDHVINVRGTDPSGAPDVVSIPLEVVASRGGVGGGGLSDTGIAVWAFLALAVALLGAGSSLLAAARLVPAGADHPAIRQERHRRMVRAVATLAGGTAALAAWLVVAATHPGDPAGLSIRHPLSVGTVLLALAAGWTAHVALRRDR